MRGFLAEAAESSVTTSTLCRALDKFLHADSVPSDTSISSTGLDVLRPDLFCSNCSERIVYWNVAGCDRQGAAAILLQEALGPV